MSTTKTATTEQITGTIANTSSALAVQAVSPPLAAQTITGTFNLVTRGMELASTDNVNKRFRALRVYSGDGATLRGTLVAYAATASTTELATSLQGQQHALNNAISSVACLDGDIIVVEFGYGLSSTGTTPQFTTEFGGSGTDHANANGDATGTVPWVEFSQNLTFFAATVALTPATATATAITVSPVSGPAVVALTPAVQPIAANAQVLTPGPVTSPLTPATVTGTAQVLTPTPTPPGPVLDLDPAWAGPATANPLSSAPFSPVANSLIIVDAHLDTSTPSETATITDSVGLTWTAIGTTQRGGSGGFATAWWAFTATARTNMTVTVNWSISGTNKTVKVRTFTGTATTSAVLSKAQGASATNNLTVNVTNTNDNARIAGSAIEWTAAGLPTSTDDEVGYHLGGAISGLSVHKAANTSGTGVSVPLNFDGGGTGSTDWAYKVYEIVPGDSGPAAVTLTTAAIATAGQALTATPGPVTAGLTTATVTATATTGAVTPGLVTMALAAAAVTLAAVVVTPGAVGVTVALTAGVASTAAQAVSSVPGLVTAPLTAAAATSAARLLTVTPGVVTVSLTPAVATRTAQPLTASPGLVTISLTPGAAVRVAVATSPVGLGPAGTISLTAATVGLSATSLAASPGLVTVGLSAATASVVARPVTATLSPGLVTLQPAGAVATGGDISLSTGMITLITGFGTADWAARPVVPVSVEGVLLHPAVVEIRARKVNPVGSVLPLNQYELPMARVLLDSLEQVLTTRTDDPPAHFALRTGAEVGWDMSQNEDLCCEGFAYVKINRVYASTDFPIEDETFSACGPLAWAADLEIGILRCAPVGTVEAIPTDVDWADTTDQVANDSVAMRLAIEEFVTRLDPLTDVLVTRSWLPVGPAGACTGGTQIVTVGWIPC